MYANVAPRSFGFTPIALVGIAPLFSSNLLWLLVVMTLPAIGLLFGVIAITRQPLTEVEAMTVEQRRSPTDRTEDVSVSVPISEVRFPV